MRILSYAPQRILSSLVVAGCQRSSNALKIASSLNCWATERRQSFTSRTTSSLSCLHSWCERAISNRRLANEVNGLSFLCPRWKSLKQGRQMAPHTITAVPSESAPILKCSPKGEIVVALIVSNGVEGLSPQCRLSPKERQGMKRPPFMRAISGG